jgi:predicted CopG family antitoxin
MREVNQDMTESIMISEENKYFLDLLKKPGESYDDVIEYLLEDFQIDYSGWAERPNRLWKNIEEESLLVLKKLRRNMGLNEVYLMLFKRGR